jgi:uncharacterized protein (TIGR03435 family)
MRGWCLLLAFACGSYCQTFDAASVKPSGPASVRMFYDRKDNPGRISYGRATLVDILYEAYSLKDYQQISGPGWLGTEAYDVIATMPPETSKKDFLAMLQNLLAERFAVVVHHETKEFPAYELVIAKNGPRLKDYDPALKPGLRATMSGASAHMVAHGQTVAILAENLRRPVDRFVVDKTGLTGRYDFELDYHPDSTASGSVGEGSAPSVFVALERQLGLKLVAGRAEFDVIVVDHANKVPTEN